MITNMLPSMLFCVNTVSDVFFEVSLASRHGILLKYTAFGVGQVGNGKFHELNRYTSKADALESNQYVVPTAALVFHFVYQVT